MPVYNEEKFVGLTLESVIKANTLGLKKEIIVVNDGSLDKTAKVLTDFAQSHKSVKIIVINKKNNESLP